MLRRMARRRVSGSLLGTQLTVRLFFVALLLGSALVSATEYRAVPRLEGHITDVANVLNKADRQRLENMLARYESETSHQIGVLFVSSLSGESIESFSLRVANAWKLGQRGIDNGILVTLAMRERSVRIEVGFGMAEYISNEESQTIIEESMVPAFRKGDYARGVEAGLQRLMAAGRRFVVLGARRD